MFKGRLTNRFCYGKHPLECFSQTSTPCLETLARKVPVKTSIIILKHVSLVLIIVGNRKQVQPYREQINCKSCMAQIAFTVSLNLLVITDDHDNYDHMRTRWCTLREFHTQTLFKNLSVQCLYLCTDFVGSGRYTRPKQRGTTKCSNHHTHLVVKPLEPLYFSDEKSTTVEK